MLIRRLTAKSELVKALTGGEPFTLTDDLLADLWVSTTRASARDPKKVKDHPRRAEMQKKAQAEAREARAAQLKAEYAQRKRRYGYR